MYIPGHFKETDTERIAALIEKYPLWGGKIRVGLLPLSQTINRVFIT